MQNENQLYGFSKESNNIRNVHENYLWCLFSEEKVGLDSFSMASNSEECGKDGIT